MGGSTRPEAQRPRRITGSALKLTLVNGVVVDVAFSGLFEWGELGRGPERGSEN